MSSMLDAIKAIVLTTRALWGIRATKREFDKVARDLAREKEALDRLQYEIDHPPGLDERLKADAEQRARYLLRNRVLF
jgi:hypothetical protein